MATPTEDRLHRQTRLDVLTPRKNGSFKGYFRASERVREEAGLVNDVAKCGSGPKFTVGGCWIFLTDCVRAWCTELHAGKWIGESVRGVWRANGSVDCGWRGAQRIGVSSTPKCLFSVVARDDNMIEQSSSKNPRSQSH